MDGQLQRVDMDAECKPNLAGTNLPGIHKVQLALREQVTGDLHFPVVYADRQDAMTLTDATLVEVDLAPNGTVVTVYVNGQSYDVK